MSFEAIDQFFKKMGEDEAMGKEFDGFVGSDVKVKIVEFAKKQGYEFTTEELDHVTAIARRIKEEQEAEQKAE